MQRPTLIRTVVCAIATVAVITGGSVLPAVAADEVAYIISVPDGQVAPLVTDLTQLGETPEHVYTTAIDGVAVSLSAAEVAAIQAENPQAQIVPDSIVTISATRAGATWGLSALDQATAPADSSYSYPDSAGTGVDVFIIDTGVANRPADFGGTLDTTRARDFTGLGTWVDCNGHGTHVAGTVGSNVYGVASKATIIPIRVLDCNGSGSMSNVLAGVNYAVSAKTPGKTAVLNMSLGGGYAAYLNTAVDAAVDAGIVSAVAAGNSAVDACGSSPASAPKALTVGALSNNLSASSFSNFGSCVDIYAPGSGITSLWLGAGTATISGTSMASPHAAGVAALYIAANPTKTAAEVTAAITGAGNVNCGTCSPNLTLNIQRLALTPTPTDPVTPPAPVVPGAPAAPTASNITATGATLSWSAPTSNGGAAIDRYLVEYRPAASATWQSVALTAPTTTTTLTALANNTTYEFRVTAHNSAGNSPASATSTLTTLTNPTSAPSRPAAPTASNITTTGATLSWSAPVSDGGAAIDRYLVEYRPATSATWQSVTVTAPTTTTTLTALSNNTGYVFRVTAHNSAGNSLASATSSLTTLTSVPSAPAAPTATNITATGATLSWSAPTSNGGAAIDRYLVEYRPATATAWQSVTVTAPATTTTLTGLTNNTNYVFRVTAHNSAGNSPASATSKSKTLTGIPSAPRSVLVSSAGTTASVSWTAPSATNGTPVTGYLVEYKASTASTWQRQQIAQPAGGAQATSTTITGLSPRLLYQVRVIAQSQFGSSAATSGGYAFTSFTRR